MVSRRGEVCLFALDKERPALVISSDAINRHSLDVCVGADFDRRAQVFQLAAEA